MYGVFVSTGAPQTRRRWPLGKVLGQTRGGKASPPNPRHFALAATLALADPTAAIHTLNQALATAEHTGTAPFAQRYAALAPAVDQAFDLPATLRTVVGPRYATITPTHQTKLLAAFRAFTICSYVANFNTGSDSFKILPQQRHVGHDVIVETEIVPPTGDHTRMDYQMRAGPAWRAVDVLEQGTISQAAVQRSDFRTLLAADDDAQGLIDSLTKKVATLSGNSVTP